MNKILVYLFVLPLLFLAACGGGTDPTIITGLSISGASGIIENSSATYTATATYSDGSSKTATASSVWSENSNYASVNSGGTVTTDSVTSDQSFTLTATYSGLTATKSITIKDGVIITGLSISGDSEIGENSSDDYTATATYSDGSSQTVTPTWSENSDYASVNSGGKVTTDSVTSDQTFTLTATYSGLTAAKSITIKDGGGGGGANKFGEAKWGTGRWE